MVHTIGACLLIQQGESLYIRSLVVHYLGIGQFLGHWAKILRPATLSNGSSVVGLHQHVSDIR